MWVKGPRLSPLTAYDRHNRRRARRRGLFGGEHEQILPQQEQQRFLRLWPGPWLDRHRVDSTPGGWTEAYELVPRLVYPPVLGGQPPGLLPHKRPSIGEGERAATTRDGGDRLRMLVRSLGLTVTAEDERARPQPSLRAETI